jgi:hypothetical protein
LKNMCTWHSLFSTHYHQHLKDCGWFF